VLTAREVDFFGCPSKCTLGLVPTESCPPKSGGTKVYLNAITVLQSGFHFKSFLAGRQSVFLWVPGAKFRNLDCIKASKFSLSPTGTKSALDIIKEGVWRSRRSVIRDKKKPVS
jgi:hypothetical protein